MSVRRCCIAGCDKPELCGVGPLNEPMCEEHYNDWLKAQRKAMDAIANLFGGLSR